MKQSFSGRDIELLGYNTPKEETQENAAPYSVFSASATAGLKRVKANFVYLKSHCTKGDVEKLRHKIGRAEDLYVIFPKSLGISPRSLEEIFPKGVAVFAYEDLMWDRMNSIFSEYMDALKTSVVTEKYYIPPRKEGGDPHDRFDDEIFDYLSGKEDLSGNLLVVCASAGVGKTTLARHLTVRLVDRSSDYRMIPTYVEASHWGKLKLESIDDLWEIIENSIRTFSPTLAIPEHLFEHCVKHGYLAFVFDGFDELCGQRHSQFRPREVLERLANIAKESNARICLTTRTLYWQSEIDDPPDNTRILSLAPFNTQQAKGYFQKYFHDDISSRDRAITLYKKLIESNVPPSKGGSRVQFVNLPLCVGMIAEYVRLGATGHLSPQSGKGIVRDVLYQICEREKGRKNLLTDAQTQLMAFEEIALDQADVLAPEFDLELLEIAGFDGKDMASLIDHPLITTTDGERYRFNYEFLPQYLRAFCLSNAMASDAVVWTDNMWKMMCREAHAKGYLLEHMLDLVSDDILDRIKICNKNVPIRFEEARSFLLRLAKSIVDHAPEFVTREERTTGLFSVFSEGFRSNGIVGDLYVVGHINELNLVGIHFVNSTFVDTVFIRCDADGTTKFENCTFSGELDFRDCPKEGWKAVELDNCVLLPPSNLVWEEIRGALTGTKEEHVTDAMRLALGKFWHHGRLKRSIRRNNWQRGSLGHSIYRDSILQAMLKEKLIEEVHISGVSEGGYAFSMESVTDLQRFMDNRQLTGKIRAVYDLLVRS